MDDNVGGSHGTVCSSGSNCQSLALDIDLEMSGRLDSSSDEIRPKRHCVLSRARPRYPLGCISVDEQGERTKPRVR